MTNETLTPFHLDEVIMHAAFIKNPSVQYYLRNNSNETNVHILKHPNGTYLKLSENAFLIWEQINAVNTLQDIQQQYYKITNHAATDEVKSLIIKLIKKDFIGAKDIQFVFPEPTLSTHDKIFDSIRSILTYQYAFKNVDDKLANLYNKIGPILFSIYFQVIVACITGLGFILFLHQTQDVLINLNNIQHAWVLLLLQSPALLLTIPMHELGHALTTKHYGREVHSLGLGWMWVGPVAFSDTTDMWLSDKRARLIVNIAGLYTNFVIGSIAAIAAYLIPSATISAFLWLFCFSNYLTIWFNLNPYLEYDGYYLLVDTFDRSHLRQHAVYWLVNKSMKTFTRLSLIKKYKIEIFYWLICFTYTLISFLILYFLQQLIVSHLLPTNIFGIKIEYLRIIIFALLIFISFYSTYLTIRREIREQQLTN